MKKQPIWSIVDEEGNAVAVTTTLNGAWAHLVVGDAGFYSIMKWMIFRSNQV